MNENKKDLSTSTPATDAVPRRKRPRRLLIVASTALLVVGATLIFPVTAYADTPDFKLTDIGGSIVRLICYVILEAACALLNAYDYIISSLTDVGYLSDAFSSLLGTTAYSFTYSVYQTAVVPIASGILGLLMLVQLVKISQRMDATATMPAIKDLVFLFAFYMIFSWFVQNGFDLLAALYDIVATKIIPAMTGSSVAADAGLGITFSTEAITEDIWETVDLGSCLVALLASFLTFIGGLIGYVLAIIIAWARAWQVYVLAAFSAIPLALLGFDETRQMGIGFLKNFASAALGMAIVVFILLLYPTIVNDFIMPSASLGDGILALLEDNGLVIALKWVASAFLLIFALIKSGSWASAILGN